ncbi:hypothetical protein TWF506_001626 [Arthrobotrys conoides]|uniref:Uncharacterized protein n=1 Tax=Arthrobotrys conoides TaxID=74498 RepID=A0AAN8NHL7_9PEZI
MAHLPSSVSSNKTLSEEVDYLEKLYFTKGYSKDKSNDTGRHEQKQEKKGEEEEEDDKGDSKETSPSDGSDDLSDSSDGFGDDFELLRQRKADGTGWIFCMQRKTEDHRIDSSSTVENGSRNAATRAVSSHIS